MQEQTDQFVTMDLSARWHSDQWYDSYGAVRRRKLYQRHRKMQCIPQARDIAAGTVTLTMTVTGTCNNPSDNIVLTITPESTADAGTATATVCYNASYTASATATNAT